MFDARAFALPPCILWYLRISYRSVSIIPQWVLTLDFHQVISMGHGWYERFILVTETLVLAYLLGRKSIEISGEGRNGRKDAAEINE